MPNSYSHLPLSRRAMLQRSAAGFGSLALAGLISDQNARAATNPLAAVEPHFTPRAKRIIFLFMKGGPSGIDTFDPKPLLTRDDGKELPFDKPRVQFAATGKLLKSPWKFRQYGESGLPVSELFPNVARHVDDLCILNSVYGTNPAHGWACLKRNTRCDHFDPPVMGAWFNYDPRSGENNLPFRNSDHPTLSHCASGAISSVAWAPC